MGNIISAEKRCNYPGRSRVTRLVYVYIKKMLPFYSNCIFSTMYNFRKVSLTHKLQCIIMYHCNVSSFEHICLCQEVMLNYNLHVINVRWCARSS